MIVLSANRCTDVPQGRIHSISSGVPCPETVLVARMTDGSYLLMAYPQREPATFVTAEDAGLLREALNAAFGTTALCTTQVQP